MTIYPFLPFLIFTTIAAICAGLGLGVSLGARMMNGRWRRAAGFGTPIHTANTNYFVITEAQHTADLLAHTIPISTPITPTPELAMPL